MAGISSEADFIFIPEDPAKPTWPQRICQKLSQASNNILNIRGSAICGVMPY
jgi:hypothetical protein